MHSWLIEDWQNITAFALSASRMGVETVSRVLTRLAPQLLAILISVIVALVAAHEQLAVVVEQVKHTNANVARIEETINTGILPIADERIRGLQLDTIQLRHDQEVLADKINDLERLGPIRCMECHMTKRTNHPARPYPLP